MADYTFISSRDPVTDDQLGHRLAVDLARAGNRVTLFLVDNGAFLARKGVCAELLGELEGAGVEIVADTFALRERGIEALAGSITATTLDTLVDHLAAGRKVAWH